MGVLGWKMCRGGLDGWMSELTDYQERGHIGIVASWYIGHLIFHSLFLGRRQSGMSQRSLHRKPQANNDGLNPKGVPVWQEVHLDLAPAAYVAAMDIAVSSDLTLTLVQVWATGLFFRRRRS